MRFGNWICFGIITGMDIEDLNNTQVLLLTLLVSFVTSIATGIVTVTLMSEAPPSVSQTINRVVERTVEKVVPSTTGTPTVTKETTVVVKEEDVLAKSIAKVSGSVVAVYTAGGDTQTEGEFVGWGVVVTNEGVIATDSAVVAEGGSYRAKTKEGATFPLSVVRQNEKTGVALLSIEQKTDKPVVFTPVPLSDSDKLSLGQSVIVLGGRAKQAVDTGIISSLSQSTPAETSTTTPAAHVSSIVANVLPPGSAPGAPLFNIFGELIGVNHKGESGVGTSYATVNAIQEEMLAWSKQKTASSQKSQ